MKPNPKLLVFLSPYDSRIQALTVQLRNFVTALIPEANELIWDNYNAVAIAYSKSDKLKDAFCHISVYEKYVNFGFNRGAELTNVQIKLEGKGKLIRHYKVTDMSSFPETEIVKMILEAVSISETSNPELAEKHSEGASVVISVAGKKRRPKK